MQNNHIVVRVRENYYWSSNTNSLVYTKKIIPLKKSFKSETSYFLYELFQMDCQESLNVLSKIIDFKNVKEGLYLFYTTNISKDWETGCVDDYDWAFESISEEDYKTLYINN